MNQCDCCGEPTSEDTPPRCKACWDLDELISENWKLAMEVYTRWELERCLLDNPKAYLKILRQTE